MARTKRSVAEAVAKSGLTAGQHRILQMIKCRAYGHRWNDHGWLAMVFRGRRLWEQEFDCDRCTMARTMRYTQALFDLDSRVYVKPTGYPGRLPIKDAKRILTGDTPAACYALAERSPFVQAA